jgi:hypothetical protein
MRSSEPFNHFVDDYLAYLHEVHPTSATLDGVHTHDDLLEDLSRQGIEQDTRALAGFSRRLQDINASDLTPVERAEQPMVAANIQARMFELEHTRTWERNPQLYADTICSGIAGQVVFSHASLPERARRVLSKLRQTKRLVQAARDNIKDPPGIFVKVGLETFRGALKFIHDDRLRKRRSPSGPTFSTSMKSSRPRPAGRFGWAATCSRRSCGSKRASRWMPTSCSPSPCAR